MTILHGTWLSHDTLGGVFAVWGENPAVHTAPNASPAPKSKYQPVSHGYLPHPFASSHTDLFDLLDHIRRLEEPGARTATILLPGKGEEKTLRPQPSPEAQQAGVPALGSGVEEGELKLTPWEIPVLTLDAWEALHFLVGLPLKPQTQSRWAYTLGGDLAYWRRTALDVLNALIGYQYIPAIEQDNSLYRAHWLPQMPEATYPMPTLCRMMFLGKADVSLAPGSHALRDSFLRATLDTFVRTAYRGDRTQSFIRALVSPRSVDIWDNEIRATAREKAKLYEKWRRWANVGTGAFRVCFRLEEPIGESEHWLLRYLLQASDDPSLLIEAGALWDVGSDAAEYAERRFNTPQEGLLAGLGRAAQIFPPIERSLRESAPYGVMLSLNEVMDFLTDSEHGASALESARFGVLIPSIWAQPIRARAKIAAKTQDNPASSGGGKFLNRDQLLSFEWEVSLGDEPLSREDFERLAALKSPLVRYKDRWVALNPDQIQAALKLFDAQPEPITLTDALKLTAPGAESEIETPTGLEVDEVAVEGWLESIIERMRDPASTEPIQIPVGFHGTLRPYQERGVAWLAQMRRIGLGACLADDMGLGKTIQVIAYWLFEREEMLVTRPALLVCPSSVVGNWRRELERFAPTLRVHVHQGVSRDQGEAFTARSVDSDVVLTSYALLSRDVDTLRGVRWSSVVLDEAQNIKNASTKAAQAARSLETDHRMALTGTPVENRLGELWSILHFLNPGYLGSAESFRARFSIPIERYGDEDRAKTLRKIVAPFILRRVKTDPTIISDLPEKFENVVFCPLTSEQASLYEAVVREEMEALEAADSDMKRRGGVLRMLTRLKQICNHPSHFLGESALDAKRSGKLTRLTEMLDEVLSTEDRALIFTQYAAMGELLHKYLQEWFATEVLYLYGGTPVGERDEMVQRFQAPHGPKLFILSLKAGGTGLNLTHASHVFHYDRWYNPAVENQATDRAFRIGQTRNVQVHKYVCQGTLEERIDALIEQKKGLAERIIGEGENWLSDMSTEELRDLVTLRREIME
jgi:superfamily II DNA or RNA helicase